MKKIRIRMDGVRAVKVDNNVDYEYAYQVMEFIVEDDAFEVDKP